MNQNYNYILGCTLFISLIIIQSAHASPDYAREARWANEVIPSILVGEPIYLPQPNGHNFLGLYSTSEQKNIGLVIAHGMGLHPNWDLIGVLRQRLNDFGYTTLSIQMPVLEATAGFDDYPKIFPDAVERLQIAVNYLKQQGFKHIVLVSHSNGSRMSRIFMTSKPENVDAWIAISLTRNETFKGVNVPVFDLYGENDLPHVLSSIKQRRKSFNSNSASRQMVVKGAGHFYVGQEEAMVDAVKLYLDKLKFN